MATTVDTAERTFIADGAIARHLRVVATATGVDVAGDEAMDGVASREAFAAGDAIAVRLRTAAGTVKCIASEAIAKGAEVWAVAAGKVAATGTVSQGTALEAAAADGDIIEVLMP